MAESTNKINHEVTVTKKQLRANLINSKKSTGPRDTSKTKNNALSHGYYLQYDSFNDIPDEDLDRLYLDLVHDYKVGTAAESNVCKMAAWNLWRYLKLAQMEAEAYMDGKKDIEKIDRLFTLSSRLEKRFLSCLQSLRQETSYKYKLKEQESYMELERAAKLKQLTQELDKIFT